MSRTEVVKRYTVAGYEVRVVRYSDTGEYHVEHDLPAFRSPGGWYGKNEKQKAIVAAQFYAGGIERNIKAIKASEDEGWV